ncbi:uncharacterized protein LOC115627331 [Scaptodrosophila lebanonensis]|uniref:Uncharacterized protein LOC115627331 n=1 Tax=Drosophila lebanonensis TaxID=7225 RepID=A0A6J2TQ93_DROLE|nr:uncharacterized protein LOC115627331 [Scaptodrosophila lebanonensis]
MSYQIKSTPFFRRMFNNSKKNGQLQRLREEYERIQEFNDRTIELKMRQVRLKRLFREIEEIKESAGGSGTTAGASSCTSNVGNVKTSSRRRLPPQVLATPENQQHIQRLEALARSKQLGKEISRRNAELAETGAHFYMRGELRMTAKMLAAADARREAVERRERAAKRISYGNAQSRSNLQRLGQRRQRRQAAGHSRNQQGAQVGHADAALISTTLALGQQRPDEEKRAMLQQRLRYGNSRSSSNMARGQAAAAAARAQSPHNLAATSTTLMESESEPLHLGHFSATSTTTTTVMAEFQEHPDLLLQEQEDHSSSAYDTDMHTAPLAAEAMETVDTMEVHSDPLALCRKETRILRMNDCQSDDAAPEYVSLTTTIAAYHHRPASYHHHHQHPHQKQEPHLENLTLDEKAQPLGSATAHWHQISLILPWLKVFKNRNGNGKDEPGTSQNLMRMGVMELSDNSGNSNSSTTSSSSSSYEDLPTTSTRPTAPTTPPNNNEYATSTDPSGSSAYTYKNVRKHVQEHEAMAAAHTTANTPGGDYAMSSFEMIDPETPPSPSPNVRALRRIFEQ